jgi:stage II sporulation protein D
MRARDVTYPSSGWRIGLPLTLLPVAVALHAPLQARGPEPVVRVLLKEAPLVEVGVAGSVPLQLRDDGGRFLLEIVPGQRMRLRSAKGGLQAELVSARGGAKVVPLPLRQAWIDPKPGSGSLLLLDNRRFRGRLKLRPAGKRLQAINVVGLETYLSSVVGSEMPASWPQEALRAQAVAARTYALRQRKPDAPFDLKATVASQVYKGVEAETPSTRQAVASTRSQVLMHGSSLIDAVFHSSSGGVTENSGDIWTRQLPYLVSVPDFDEASPVRRWEKRLEPAELRKAFPELGGLTDLDVLRTSRSGRIQLARVTGPRGTQVIKGAELRKRLGLRSTLVTFRFEAPEPAAVSGDPRTAAAIVPPPLPLLPDILPRTAQASLAAALRPEASPALVARGRGFGHGVGMSQWGAYGMAQRGRSHEEILRHFYRGVAVRTYTGR